MQFLMQTGQALQLDRITHRFGDATAVDDISLNVAPGELVALLGPSGCGKTTLLKTIAGFVRQSAGRVLIGGEVVDPLPPNRRRVGIVFQNYALFPHMTVSANVAYGLDARGWPRADKATRVRDMLAMVHMGGHADRYPRQLSGGQQQRVAIARALAVDPGLLLLDEPFAALDKALRLDMQIEVKRIQRQAGTTTILVTHDQEEALSLADRVAVLRAGRIEQFASPSDIYDNPASLFVNTFVGVANILPGEVEREEGAEVAVRLDGGARIVARRVGRMPPGSRAQVCLRPEQLRIEDGEGFLPGEVELGLPLGASIVHEIRTAAGAALKVTAPRAAGAVPLSPGTRVGVSPVPGAAANAYPA
jgi:putative spermidine/putrescine transport system ATP-binding protein